MSAALCRTARCAELGMVAVDRRGLCQRCYDAQGEDLAADARSDATEARADAARARDLGPEAGEW